LLKPPRTYLLKYGTAGQATGSNIMLPMRMTSWIPKATNTLSEYVMLTAFTLQRWLHECVSVLRYTCIVFLNKSSDFSWLVFGK
jgi:hypothetical protein